MRTRPSQSAIRRPWTSRQKPRKADVLIVAAGKPKLIGADHVREDAVVIDVGINTVKGEKLEDEIAGNQLVGDVISTS